MVGTSMVIRCLTASAVILVGLLIPATAPAHELTVSGVSGGPTAQAAPASCGGAEDASFDPQATKVITGEFGPELQGSYVMLPFDVPAGPTAVRVRYCYDQPEAPTNAQIKHTLDLGLYEPRPAGDALWDENEFRGWGGSTHTDVTVSPNGFSPESLYRASPRLHRQGYTTRGFEPGAIPAGQWAVELGVAAVASRLEGDADGKVAWRVQIDMSSDPRWSADPYVPAQYDSTPAIDDPGWYTGDFHVHAEHSSLGDATMRETFAYAFKQLKEGGAGLDFITLSDYVTDTGWGEIGRHQPNHRGKLIVRSSEVITYRGHANNHASARFVDYRTGPILERNADDGSLKQLRGPVPATRIFDDVHAAGGFTQINHPTIFPSQVPGFSFMCRGCPWDFSDEETDYSKVDAIEIATGPAGANVAPLDPGPNPFTTTAIQFYEDALATGAKIAAVGSSDSHKAGSFTPLPEDPPDTSPSLPSAPIGVATTVVCATELSEEGINRGVKGGHTYVKVFGNDGPDLRFEAREPGSAKPQAIMGDTLETGSAILTARVLGVSAVPRLGPFFLLVVKDNVPLHLVPVTGDDFRFDFPSLGPGRYRLQVMRFGGVAAIEAVSSPIYLAADDGDSTTRGTAAGARDPHVRLCSERARGRS